MAKPKKTTKKKSKETLAQLVGRRLEALRDERDLSQGDVARLAKTTRTSVSRWETGQTLATLNHLELLARFYDVSLDHLVFADVPKTPRGFVKDSDTLKLLASLPLLDEDSRNAMLRFMSSLDAERRLKEIL